MPAGSSLDIALPRDTQVIYPFEPGNPSSLMMTSWWLDALQNLFETISGGIIGALFANLTPAASVRPTLELVEENGVLAVVLDRTTTNIEPATLNGATPPDGYRFTISAINDATDGRLLTWDAAYHGMQENSGMADAMDNYSFYTGGGQFFITAQQIGIL